MKREKVNVKFVYLVIILFLTSKLNVFSQPHVVYNWSTTDFVKVGIANSNISIVLCGHIHTSKTESYGGLLQFVTPMARYGHYRIIDIVPVKEIN